MTGGAGHGRPRYGRLAAANAAVLGLIVVLLFPVYWMFISSLRGESQFAFPPKFLPTDPSAVSYVQIFTQKPLGTWLLNSTVVSLASTVLAIGVSAPAVFVLAGFQSARLTSFSIACSGTWWEVSRAVRSRDDGRVPANTQDHTRW